MKYVRCELEKADFLLVEAIDKGIELVKIEKTNCAFKFRLHKYIYNSYSRRFEILKFSLSGESCEEIINKYSKGHTSNSYANFHKLYGKNETKLVERPLFKVLLDEILSPFYVFQILSLVVWFIENYTFFAIVIGIASVISIVISLRDYKRNFRRIQEMSEFEIEVEVIRRKSDMDSSMNLEKISSNDLVPGDLIKIPEQKKMPCDILLLTGTAIMNESVLTGESIPIQKISIPNNSSKYLPDEESKKNTLFAGTRCIETRNINKASSPVFGIVTSTGFNTIKGSLIRSILFAANNDFQFYKDAMKFVACMFIIAMCGSVYTIISLTNEGAKFADIIMQSLDIITVTVPPALPTCMSIGISLALAKLKTKNIFCISPLKVNVAGNIQIFCFDKTGTLTEDDLDTKGAIPIVGNQFSREVNVPELKNSRFIEMLASCHSLTIVSDTLLGDPLDIKMFQSTNWKIEESENILDPMVESVVVNPANASHRIKILKRNDFSSKLQRMSVIVNIKDGYEIFVKGSPEKIRELSISSSIPENFHEVLELYAKVNPFE